VSRHLFCEGLLVQSNGQWEAVLATSEPGYALRLLALAGEVADPRVTALRNAARPKVNLNLCFYPPTCPVTDVLLPLQSALVELLRRKTCKWFAFAEGTTVFGSHVVASILSSPAPVGDTLPADMLLLPSDSVKFARQGEHLESVLCTQLALTGVSRLNMVNVDYERRGDVAWHKRCVGMDAMTSLYQITYTTQPVPQEGRLLLPSVVYNREKLALEYSGRPCSIITCVIPTCV
jgi:hypothetical protein